MIFIYLDIVKYSQIIFNISYINKIKIKGRSKRVIKRKEKKN